MRPSTTLAAAALLLVAAPASHAALLLSRETVTNVNTGALGTFAGAGLYYVNTLFVTGTGSLDLRLSFVTLARDGEYSVSGGVTSTLTGNLPGPQSGPIDLTLTGDGRPGTWSFNYFADAGILPGQSFITRSIIGGRYALTFSGGGTNFVSGGGSFVSDVFLSGDWTDPANRTSATFSPG